MLFGSNKKDTNQKYGHYTIEKEKERYYDPISMELSPNMQLIDGFREAIYTMNAGDIIYTYIPSNLAYGKEAKGNTIPANSDLIFIIEMSSVKN